MGEAPYCVNWKNALDGFRHWAQLFRRDDGAEQLRADACVSMVNCPKCGKPEFSVVGVIPRSCFQTNTQGRWMLRHISRRWIVHPVLPAYVEFKCPCGAAWKEQAK